MKRVRRLAATIVVLALGFVPLTASAAAWIMAGALAPFGDGLALLTWVLAVVTGFLGLSGLFLKLLVQPTMEKMITAQRQELATVLESTAAAFLERLTRHETAAEMRWAAHHADPAAHPAGSSARIDPLRESLHILDLGQRELLAKLNAMCEDMKEEAQAISEIDLRLSGLEKEHCLLHGSVLEKRASDPLGLEPEKLRGKKRAGDR